MASYYENYRRGLIERHICKNGRLNQAILLCQRKKGEEVGWLPKRRTTESTTGGVPIAYEAYPVVLDRKVIGGGDNPLLSGGLLMMVFAIEDMLGVSRYSLEYATRLLSFFEESQRGIGELYRRRQWWHDAAPVSKDELVGLLLGLDFYLQAVHRRPNKQREAHRARDLMCNVGSHLQRNHYGPALSWVFQFPFTRLFKFNLGMSMISDTTVPPGLGRGDAFMNILLNILMGMSLLNWWYKPKNLYCDTMRYLPLAYQGASAVDYPRKFFNVALYCHTVQMIFNKPVKSKVLKETWKAFNTMFNYFARHGRRLGQGEGAQNAYLGLVAHAFAQSLGSCAVDDRAPSMYKATLHPEGVWAPNLPIFCLDGSMRFHHYYEGSEDRLWGERFTWEHRDPKGHYLQWGWPKVLRSIGPPSRLDLEGVEYADQEKGYVLEAAGLGLLVVQALAAYYKLAPAPKLEDDSQFPTFPLDGPAP